MKFHYLQCLDKRYILKTLFFKMKENIETRVASKVEEGKCDHLISLNNNM